jgi:hypothetical protein
MEGLLRSHWTHRTPSPCLPRMTALLSASHRTCLCIFYLTNYFWPLLLPTRLQLSVSCSRICTVSIDHPLSHTSPCVSLAAAIQWRDRKASLIPLHVRIPQSIGKRSCLFPIYGKLSISDTEWAGRNRMRGFYSKREAYGLRLYLSLVEASWKKSSVLKIFDQWGSCTHRNLLSGRFPLFNS